MQSSNIATRRDLTNGLSIRAQKILIVAGGSLSAFMYVVGALLLSHHYPF